MLDKIPELKEDAEVWKTDDNGFVYSRSAECISKNFDYYVSQDSRLRVAIINNNYIH